MTISVLGGGQLGRMMALAAYRLGERVVLLDPNPESCGGHVAPLVVGRWQDPAPLAELSRRGDIVTFEFENVPDEAARFLADRVAVAPPPQALTTAQDRLLEKQLFTELGIPTPPYRPASSLAELRTAAAEVGLPAVVKTRRFGYDGKGQHVVRSADDVDAAWLALGAAELLIESFVPFDQEVSAIAARAHNGEVARYPLVENSHRGGILRTSRPLSATDPLAPQAAEYIDKVLGHLDYVGVLTLEFFVVGGQLLVNEMAPRVHNSGHYSIDGAETSQFENHVRAILDLPLGSTETMLHCVMLNCIGGMPSNAALCALPGTKIHAYGKRGSPGRKVGHVTVVASTAAELQARLPAVQALVDAASDG
ncbi:MAG: 5-(carboxyamino)imidazole ribonucleotide synthase [Myxococcales bacterium]|nr:5-(carboxyamino)imidazole ribonucleotide synthase [Myxococcales bacterium]